MSEEIDRQHALLNAEELVEPRWYDRNHKAYELVCYVNTVMGLYLAGHYEPIPAFLDRVHGYLSREDKAQVSERYRQVVEVYIRLVARALESSPNVSAKARSWIPRPLLED